MSKQYHFVVVWDSESSRWHVASDADAYLSDRIVYDLSEEKWEERPSDVTLDDYVRREQFLADWLNEMNNLVAEGEAQQV